MYFSEFWNSQLIEFKKKKIFMNFEILIELNSKW